MKSKRSICFGHSAKILVGSLATLLVSHSANAVNVAWSTAPADANFTGINWTAGTVPGAAGTTLATGDALFFGTSTVTSLTDNEVAGWNLAGLTFNSGASAFTINGTNSNNLAGNITNSSTNLQTINVPLALTANRTVTMTTGGGDITLGGVISGAFGLTTAGTGTLILSGANTYTGTTTVATGGILKISGSGRVGASAVGGTGSSSALAVNGVFDLNGLSQNVDSLTGAGTIYNNSGAGTSTLQIGNNNGNSSFSGVIADNDGISTGGKVGLTAFGFSNTSTLTGANTYTGSTRVIGGTLNLGGGGASGSISSSSTLLLGGTGGGGTLAYTRTGTVAQTFNGTSIRRGGNSITTSTGTQTLNLGAITGVKGGTVDIRPFAGSTVTTTSVNTNGILGGYVTVNNKADWATVSGGNIVAYTGYTASTAGTTAPGATANVDFQATNTTNWTTQTINTLRFNQATTQTLTIAAGNLLTIGAGGILNTSTASNGGTITGGQITGSAGGQLAVSTAGGTVSINSQVVDNGGSTSVVISGTGTGRQLGLGNTSNSFSGGLYINGGGVNVNTGGTSLGVGNVYFGNNSVYTGAAGGGLLFGTASPVVSSGLIAAANGNNNSNGDISGNSGGYWNLYGAQGDVQTFAGIVGNYAPGRVVNFAVGSGTEIIGNTQVGMNQVIANGGTYQIGTGYWGNVSNANNNVALVLGGGTFVEFGNYTGTTLQDFKNGLTVNAGASTVTINNNSAGGTAVTLTGATSRNIGGTVNFNLPSGTQSATNGITSTSVNVNGILGGYATVGGTDWATNATNLAGGNIIALPSGSYTNDTWTAGNNTTVTTSSAPTSGSTTNSLRFNASGASVVTLAGTNTITSGGILVTSAVGANLTTLTGGTLTGTASADLVIIQNNTSGGLTIDSIIANNTGATALTKSGAGLLTLTGTNTYTGKLFLNGGTLNAATANINGSSTTNNINFNGGTLQAAAGGITTSKAVAIGTNGGTFDTNGNDSALNGVISGTPSTGAGALGGFVASGVYSFTKTGAGTLTLGGANTFGGGLIINNGTVKDNNALATTLGTGYVTFGASNTPTLDLNGRSATVAGLIGTGTNGVITNGGAVDSTLTLNGVFGEIYSGVIQNGATNTTALTVNLNNPTQAQVLTNTSTYSGTTTITNGALQLGDGTTGHDGTIGNSLSVVNNASLIYNRFGSSTYSGVISGSGTVIKTGAGTQTLIGANTYSGTTTITTGALQLGDGTTGHDGTIGSSLSIVNNASLIYNRFGSSSYGGVISGSGSVTKTGAGTQTLSNTNTYTGTTLVSAGKLIVNGSLSTGAVTVGNNATLGGSGTIGGATTIQSGGVHAPGNSPGIENFTSDLTYANGSIFAWDIDRTLTGRGTAYDGVNVTGTLGGGGSAVFRIVIGDSDFSNAFWSANNHTWTDIFTSADGTTPKTGWASIFGGGFQYYNSGGSLSAPTTGSFSLSGNTLSWNFSAVPEVSNALAGVLLAAGILRRKRRLA